LGVTGAATLSSTLGVTGATTLSSTLGVAGATTLFSVATTSGTIANTPSGSTDIANKAYVDTVAQGLDTKASVVAGTTANITLSGTQTIDGVVLIAGDRVLVKNQTTTANNGLYLCAASSWTRTTDMDNWAEVPGAYVFVEQGTTLADTGWVCTSDAGGAIVWAQFSGAGSGVSSINFGTTGLTPSSVTTGAVTVAGTLAVANGGTNITTYAVGDIIYASTTGVLSKLADIATGSALITGGVNTAPSYGKIGLTTHVSGNLPVTNLNSGTSASASTFWRGDGVWSAPATSGTVTSVAATVPSLFSISGSPITTSGTLAMTYSGTALPVANGGTGQTSYTDGQLLIGNTTGNTLTKTTLTAGSGITITNGNGSISIASSGGASAATPTALGTVYGKQTSGGGTPYLTAFGYNAGVSTTGAGNTAMGTEALQANTNATFSTAVGYQAGYAATGAANQFFGYNSGSAITSGTNNVILGSYTGNSNGRDIRTSSDSIVLSDGAGVPRMVCVNGGYWTTALGFWGSAGINAHSSGVDNAVLFSASSGSGTVTMYFGNAAITTSSDVRLKENIVDSQRNATEIINNLRVVDHTWNDPSDQCENNRNSRGVWTGLIAQEAINHIPWLVNKPTTDVDEKGNNQYWHMDYGYAVPLLIKALQELNAKFDAYVASHP